MYGCFDGVLIYGIMEDSREKLLDETWLEANYPGVRVFAGDVVRNYMGNAVYGVTCSVDEEGRVEIHDHTIKAQVDKLAEVMKAEIRFHISVYGDYETGQHDRYTPPQ